MDTRRICAGTLGLPVHRVGIHLAFQEEVVVVGVGQVAAAGHRGEEEAKEEGEADLRSSPAC